MKKQAVSVFFAVLIVLASVSLRKALANAASAASPWQNTNLNTTFQSSTAQAVHFGSAPVPVAPNHRTVAMGSSPGPIPPYRTVAMGSSPVPIPPYRTVAMGSSPVPIPPYRRA